MEVYGLTLQLRRAGVSVAANIAEGFKKTRNADKKRFMNIAQSSLEVMSLLFNPIKGSRLWRYFNLDGPT